MHKSENHMLKSENHWLMFQREHEDDLVMWGTVRLVGCETLRIALELELDKMGSQGLGKRRETWQAFMGGLRMV